MSRTTSKYLLMMFFGIVIAAGESFKINDVNVSGVVLGLIGLHMGAATLLGRGPKVRLYSILVALIVFIFAVMGVLNYPIGDVIEDGLPFIVFLLLATNLQELQAEDHVGIYRFIILVSAVTVFKVLAINYLDLDVSWGGNTFWQAGKSDLLFGLHRVILKGADVYFCLSATTIILTLMIRKRQFVSLFSKSVSVLLLAGLLASVVFSFTRASVVAIVGALTLSGLLLRQSKTMDSKKILLFASLCLLFIAINTGSIFYRAFYARWTPESDRSVEFRQDEISRVIDAAHESRYLGSGFGAYFYIPLSGSTKDDGRSLYVHTLPGWLLLKIGLVGLSLFYVFIFHAIYSSVKKLRVSSALARDVRLLLAIRVVGLFFMLMNDFINNKFATVSGASAYALLISLGTFRAVQRPVLQPALHADFNPPVLPVASMSGSRPLT